MKRMPWHLGSRPPLSHFDIHVAQLVALNQPETLRSALATTRAEARFLIRGARGCDTPRNRYPWRQTIGVLQQMRHSARAYVAALSRLGEETAAQAHARG